MIVDTLDAAPNSSAPDFAGAPSFGASDYLLGIIQRIVSVRENSRIVLPGNGEIAVFPSRNAYDANVRDMVEFCQAPASGFDVSTLADAALPHEAGFERSLAELLWQAAFHASQGRLLAGCSKYDVVQFRYWPNLSRLPTTENTMRICALLTRHPTTIMLVHRKLGIDTREIYQVYSAAHSAGVAHMVSRNPEATVGHGDAVDAEVGPDEKRGLFRSLLAKIAGL